MKKPFYADLADHGEDVRIDTIGHAAMHYKKTVGFVTDDEPGKAERYILKLMERFPGIVIHCKHAGPVKNSVFVKVGPPLKGEASQNSPPDSDSG